MTVKELKERLNNPNVKDNMEVYFVGEVDGIPQKAGGSEVAEPKDCIGYTECDVEEMTEHLPDSKCFIIS